MTTTDLRSVASGLVQELATLLNKQTRRGATIAVDAMLDVVRENVAAGDNPDDDGPTWSELETMLERVRHSLDRLDPVPPIELVHRVAGRDFDGSADGDASSSASSDELAADRSPDPDAELVDDDPAIDDEPPIGSFPWERPDPIEPIDEPSNFDAWERSY